MSKLQLILNVSGADTILTMNEARELYHDLQSIFGNTQVIPSGPISREPLHPEQSKITEQMDKNKNSNPRVEEARKRATERTSGCGSRR